jgi:hypothetical protein
MLIRLLSGETGVHPNSLVFELVSQRFGANWGSLSGRVRLNFCALA